MAESSVTEQTQALTLQESYPENGNGEFMSGVSADDNMADSDFIEQGLGKDTRNGDAYKHPTDVDYLPDFEQSPNVMDLQQEDQTVPSGYCEQESVPVVHASKIPVYGGAGHQAEHALTAAQQQQCEDLLGSHGDDSFTPFTSDLSSYSQTESQEPFPLFGCNKAGESDPLEQSNGIMSPMRENQDIVTVGPANVDTSVEKTNPFLNSSQDIFSNDSIGFGNDGQFTHQSVDDNNRLSENLQDSMVTSDQTYNDPLDFLSKEGEIVGSYQKTEPSLSTQNDATLDKYSEDAQAQHLVDEFAQSKESVSVPQGEQSVPSINVMSEPQDYCSDEGESYHSDDSYDENTEDGQYSGDEQENDHINEPQGEQRQVEGFEAKSQQHFAEQNDRQMDQGEAFSHALQSKEEQTDSCIKEDNYSAEMEQDYSESDSNSQPENDEIIEDDYTDSEDGIVMEEGNQNQTQGIQEKSGDDIVEPENQMTAADNASWPVSGVPMSNNESQELTGQTFTDLVPGDQDGASERNINQEQMVPTNEGEMVPTNNTQLEATGEGLGQEKEATEKYDNHLVEAAEEQVNQSSTPEHGQKDSLSKSETFTIESEDSDMEERSLTPDPQYFKDHETIDKPSTGVTDPSSFGDETHAESGVKEATLPETHLEGLEMQQGMNFDTQLTQDGNMFSPEEQRLGGYQPVGSDMPEQVDSDEQVCPSNDEFLTDCREAAPESTSEELVADMQHMHEQSGQLIDDAGFEESHQEEEQLDMIHSGGQVAHGANAQEDLLEQQSSEVLQPQDMDKEPDGIADDADDMVVPQSEAVEEQMDTEYSSKDQSPFETDDNSAKGLPDSSLVTTQQPTSNFDIQTENMAPSDQNSALTDMEQHDTLPKDSMPGSTELNEEDAFIDREDVADESSEDEMCVQEVPDHGIDNEDRIDVQSNQQMESQNELFQQDVQSSQLMENQNELLEQDLQSTQQMENQKEFFEQDMHSNQRMESQSELFQQDVQSDQQLENQAEPIQQDVQSTQQKENQNELFEQDMHFNQRMESQSGLFQQDVQSDQQLENQEEPIQQDVQSAQQMENQNELFEQDLQSTKQIENQKELSEQDIHSNQQMESQHGQSDDSDIKIPPGDQQQYDLIPQDEKLPPECQEQIPDQVRDDNQAPQLDQVQILDQSPNDFQDHPSEQRTDDLSQGFQENQEFIEQEHEAAQKLDDVYAESAEESNTQQNFGQDVIQTNELQAEKDFEPVSNEDIKESHDFQAFRQEEHSSYSSKEEERFAESNLQSEAQQLEDAAIQREEDVRVEASESALEKYSKNRMEEDEEDISTIEEPRNLSTGLTMEEVARSQLASQAESGISVLPETVVAESEEPVNKPEAVVPDSKEAVSLEQFTHTPEDYSSPSDVLSPEGSDLVKGSEIDIDKKSELPEITEKTILKSPESTNKEVENKDVGKVINKDLKSKKSEKSPIKSPKTPMSKKQKESTPPKDASKIPSPTKTGAQLPRESTKPVGKTTSTPRATSKVSATKKSTAKPLPAWDDSAVLKPEKPATLRTPPAPRPKSIPRARPAGTTTTQTNSPSPQKTPTTTTRQQPSPAGKKESTSSFLERMSRPTHRTPKKDGSSDSGVEDDKTSRQSSATSKKKYGIDAKNSTYKPGGGNVKIKDQKMPVKHVGSRIDARSKTPTSPRTELSTHKSSPSTPKTPSPSKNVGSKIGSLNNASHTPGGGNVKIQSQKVDFSNVSGRIGSKANLDHKPKGGDKKILSQKLEWKVESRIGSLDNSKHTPGGGNVKIASEKKNWNVQSRIGSLDNAKHSPGGGQVKIINEKVEWKTGSRIGSLEKASHSPGGGNVKIESKKLDFKEKASSKVGSKDFIDHKPGGGDKKIETKKLDFKEKASSRVGSKDNIGHKAGGGDKKIETQKVDFKDKASSKVGSKDYLDHKPGGGEKKIESQKLTFKETAKPRTDTGGSTGKSRPDSGISQDLAKTEED